MALITFISSNFEIFALTVLCLLVLLAASSANTLYSLVPSANSNITLKTGSDNNLFSNSFYWFAIDKFYQKAMRVSNPFTISLIDSFTLILTRLFFLHIFIKKIYPGWRYVIYQSSWRSTSRIFSEFG